MTVSKFKKTLRRSIFSDLAIDHIDGNPRNNAYPNLHLLCHRCNIAERNRQRSKSVSVKTPDPPHGGKKN